MTLVWCRLWDPNFNAVGKSWKKVPKEKRDYHFFATLDFKDGQDIFRRVSDQSLQSSILLSRH